MTFAEGTAASEDTTGNEWETAISNRFTAIGGHSGATLPCMDNE